MQTVHTLRGIYGNSLCFMLVTVNTPGGNYWHSVCIIVLTVHKIGGNYWHSVCITVWLCSHSEVIIGTLCVCIGVLCTH